MRREIRVCDVEHPDEEIAVAVKEVTFVGPQGNMHMVELCEDHLDKFVNGVQQVLESWTREARLVDQEEDDDGPIPPKSSTRKHVRNEETSAIRAWATAHQMDIGNRGRVPAEIRRQWEAAGRPQLTAVPPAPAPAHPSEMRPTSPPVLTQEKGSPEPRPDWPQRSRQGLGFPRP